jgi:putative transposase
MDNTTHEMRLAGWKQIIENCQARPDGQTVKQWLAEQGIQEKNYYYWLRKVRKTTYELMTKEKVPVSSPSSLSFAEIPMRRTAAPAGSSQPDVVIQKGRLRIELNNSISDELLVRILETISHV